MLTNAIKTTTVLHQVDPLHRVALAGHSMLMSCPKQSEDIDKLFMDFVIQCALPLSLENAPAIKKLFAKLRPVYFVPCRKKLAGPLLSNAFSEMDKRVKNHIAASPYVCVCFDGWSRVQGQGHVLGFTAVNAAADMSVFLDFVPTDQEGCTAQFQFQKFERILEKHSLVMKTAGLVTDTTSVMKVVWNKVLTTIKDIFTFFDRHQIYGSMLASQQQRLGVTTGLKMFCKTLFSSNFLMVDFVFKNKDALAATVVQPAFSITTEQARNIKAHCLNDEWFEKVAFTRNVLGPIAKVVRSLQADNCSQADAFWLVKDLAAALLALEEGAADEERAGLVATVRAAVQERINDGYHPCQTLAAMLHPKYRCRIMSIPQAERKAAQYLFCVLASRTVEKETDAECLLTRPWKVDSESMEADTHFFWYRFDSNLSKLSMSEADFQNPGILTDAIQFWTDKGDHCQVLRDVALRVACLPATACAGERVFNAFSHVWSDRWASLHKGRATMLAYVYFIQRFIDRIEAPSDIELLEECEEFQSTNSSLTFEDTEYEGGEGSKKERSYRSIIFLD
ncbi:hypothetical protein CEUSTIGMA_g5624.t1 [Chlamydomonas eustigma]|uniref:HAT C-terminal dimerisation domain-containing protein n=1 Tax=Chlamydomonas eustigma TaxID=1157962 RepID=A0A250X5L1_9CHLO|nr:hypothetical protein CEUSTIGMA_g5624.t1 [Chlamydomonas eustigma]|eukprot:GAX78182.1 hypothetical protein CEUSTIGMA_g5624.t1 [Chlamydomonas eustigma]